VARKTEGGPAKLPDPETQPTMTVEEFAWLWNIGRTLAYDLARRDELPVPVLRVGNLYRIPTAPVLKALGATPATAGDGGASDDDHQSPSPTPPDRAIGGNQVVA
jgi:excisionase family DNA binding protein